MDEQRKNSNLLEQVEEVDLEKSETSFNDNTIKSENVVQSNDEASTVEVETSSNCLSLTVQKDYKLSIAKNVFFKSIRSSLKVAFSVFALNLLKLFL